MKNKMITYFFVLFLFFFLGCNIVMKDRDISYRERRSLAQFPSFDEDFFENFEEYSLDQFPFRDWFLKVKSYYTFYGLHNLDYHNLFVKNDSIYKLETEMNDKGIQYFTNLIQGVVDTYFKDNKIYYGIILDKSYFLDMSYPKYDYQKLYGMVQSAFQDYQYLDIASQLKIEDYYKTDPHWNQANLLKIVQYLSDKMDFSYQDNYEIRDNNSFYGAYYSQLGLSIKEETLSYYTNELIENVDVWMVDEKDHSVYEEDKLSSFDPYTFFLGGTQPLITITNDEGPDKELILFRDSFGSSIAPLLIPYYSKITMIDLRYINMENVVEYVDIKDQDVLFLYSTLLVNHSETLKK